jgi:magnesium-transporting ATPase (P-type)
MIDPIWPLIGLTLSAGAILLLQDWRFTFPALLLNYLSLTVFLGQRLFAADQPLDYWTNSTIIAVKLMTGIAVTAILTITALMFSQDFGLEELDEFGLAELRRAARAAQRLRASRPFRLSDYTIPFWALLLALLATFALVSIYPVATSPLVDFAWYWLGLTGLFTLAVAADLRKVGLGLLLCLSSIDLLYTAVVNAPNASGVGVMSLTLLSLLTISLALAVAYLSALLYDRLKTLELSELYNQRT